MELERLIAERKQWQKSTLSKMNDLFGVHNHEINLPDQKQTEKNVIIYGLPQIDPKFNRYRPPIFAGDL